MGLDVFGRIVDDKFDIGKKLNKRIEESKKQFPIEETFENIKSMRLATYIKETVATRKLPDSAHSQARTQSTLTLWPGPADFLKQKI